MPGEDAVAGLGGATCCVVRVRGNRGATDPFFLFIERPKLASPMNIAIAIIAGMDTITLSQSAHRVHTHMTNTPTGKTKMSSKTVINAFVFAVIPVLCA